MIYAFPNGGPMSWYNYPQKENGMGEGVFVKELIPHADSAYRTHATRGKRGLEGFSQGGRGTTRIMFKYPELFGSVAPGGSGYEPEERIRNKGARNRPGFVLIKAMMHGRLPRNILSEKSPPPLKPLIWVGTKGFNYEYNLKYLKYLDSLGIPSEKLIVPGRPSQRQVDLREKRIGYHAFPRTEFQAMKGRVRLREKRTK